MDTQIIFSLCITMTLANPQDETVEDLLTGDAVNDEAQGISISHGCYI